MITVMGLVLQFMKLLIKSIIISLILNAARLVFLAKEQNILEICSILKSFMLDKAIINHKEN